MKTTEKIFSAVKAFLGHTGFCFTFIVMALTISLAVTYPDETKFIDTSTYGWILLFSAGYAICNFVFNIKFIDSYLAKLSIHYVLVVLDFAIVIAWLSGISNGSKQTLFVTIAFAFVYVIVEAVRAGIHFALHKKKNEEETYQSLFSGKN